MCVSIFFPLQCRKMISQRPNGPNWTASNGMEAYFKHLLFLFFPPHLPPYLTSFLYELWYQGGLMKTLSRSTFWAAVPGSGFLTSGPALYVNRNADCEWIKTTTVIYFKRLRRCPFTYLTLHVQQPCKTTLRPPCSTDLSCSAGKGLRLQTVSQ